MVRSVDGLGPLSSWMDDLINSFTDESGWAWFIPLHDGTTSIGIVMNEKVYHAKNKNSLPISVVSHLASSTDSNVTHRYLSHLSYAPGVLRLVTEQGTLVSKKGVRSANDFSYSAPSYAGNGYRIVGDAGGKKNFTRSGYLSERERIAFIDPFFSSGVHLAMTSALSASATICASIRQDCCESMAARWHTQRVSTSYTRLVLVGW